NLDKRCYNSDMECHNKKSAFTLAEVLITLGIIGVVAALTMPVLIGNYKDKVTANQLRKTYSVLSQAIKMAQAEYGDISQWPILDGNMESTDELYLNYLKPYLKIVDECRNSNKCFTTNDAAIHMYSFSLNDGTKVLFDIWNHVEGTDDMYGSYGVKSYSEHYLYRNFIAFTVDINGNKKPNVSGKDIFTFVVSKNGVIPLGLDQDEGTTLRRCNKDNFSANWCTAYMLSK
ncbi:MAG: prepilin-type N-terminal cleavage/methylation domain-containing protein, partial [Candidatus Gastranaerophilaceae bacterium]